MKKYQIGIDLGGVAVKVIFETDALSVEQVKRFCECAIAAGVDFVKTSTVFLIWHKKRISNILKATYKLIKTMYYFPKCVSLMGITSSSP